MELEIIKGTIISSPTLNELSIIEKGYIVIRKGIILGVYDELPNCYKDHPITDFGDSLILQSFSDMHLHAPQYPMLGTGMDLPLLEWLNTYTFPNEARFENIEYARKVYKKLASELIRLGTTRVCMFSSLHLESTIVLMEELEKAGIVGYVGKVNMDRNSPKELSETTKESMENTIKWLDESKKFKNIKPIITPRFTPSCSNELMTFLGEVANEQNLPIQSHLSENLNEIEWVRSLVPNTKYYYQAYEKFNLWNDKTLMAHCVHVNKEERQAIKEAGVYVVHCPDSNINLTSGIAPIKTMLKEGLNVVLGSDIAGGDHLDGFDVITSAVRVSKCLSVYDKTSEPLNLEEAWYLSTSSANRFFNEKPGFAKGNEFHAIVIDDSELISSKPLTNKERFERILYRKNDAKLLAVYSKGNRLI